MRFAASLTSPKDQFRCEVLGAVVEILTTLPPDVADALEQALPSLAGYRAAAARCWEGYGQVTPAQWRLALANGASRHPAWPLQRLGLLGLGPLHARVLVALTMVEEDPALSLLFEPEPGALTLGGLVSRLRGFAGIDAPEAVREALIDLTEAGLAELTTPGVARTERRYKVYEPVAELLLGIAPRLAGARFRPADDLPDGAEWIAPGARAPAPDAAAAVLGDADAIMVVRGAAHNGRKTFAAMAARAAGLALIECGPGVLADDSAFRCAAAVATLSGAAMLVELELAPSETLRLPAASAAAAAPLILICARQGAIEAPVPMALRTMHLPMPDGAARRAHWLAAGAGNAAAMLGSDWILTSGNIRRAGAAAAPSLGCATVRSALRDLRDARLELLASAVDSESPPGEVFLDAEAQEELDLLVARCRHREALCEPGGLAGVRALLSGPSGVGKTLAARHVAWRLGRDLFRIDLSATVNKYIGETEKALERALAAAEELDIVILLDEGDALMARRTDVSNANDRYANLETNFLLQRIENFGGILLVTSNDAERIDAAFARRMDAAIVLRPPDQVRRESILNSHLGPEAAVSAGLVRDIACRCVMTGGQIRNIALHARLLGLEGSGTIGDAELRAALEREYRKLGSPCPLRGGRGDRQLAAVG